MSIRCTMVAGLMLAGSSAFGASMADVDALIEKAQSRLRSSTTKNAAVLREAAAIGNDALNVLQEVKGISEEVRDAKGAEIMSMIYWCRKMTPLDLSGRSISAPPPSTAPPPSRGQQPTQAPPKPDANKPKTKGIDELAYKRAEEFERKNASELQEVVSRYAAIAASFPNTTWGKKADDRAERARKKLTSARTSAMASMNARILKLELEPLLGELDGKIAAAPATTKQRLLEIRTDITRLKAVWDRLIKALETTRAGITVPLAEFGHAKEGWVRGGGADGVIIATGKPNGEKRSMSWVEFGAAGMVRLAARVLSMSNGKSIEDVAVAATVAEDFTTAHALFEKLLLTAPERVSMAGAYFERALAGYRQSSEGDTKTRFDKAKTLVRSRKFVEAMRELTALQEKLAKDSSMKDVLEELVAFRRDTRRRYKVNDLGEPMNDLERKVVKAFGGDAKLDVNTGQIEIFYDFEDSKQMRDWSAVSRYGKVAWGKRWGVARGVASCSGGNSVFMWSFPLENYEIEADVSYASEDWQFRFYTGLSEARPLDSWFTVYNGRASFESGEYGYYGFGLFTFERSSFIWRPGEVAQLKIAKPPGDESPILLTINDKHGAYGFEDGGASKGCIGFCFYGGQGTVDNVLIRGKIDMVWFEKATQGMR